MRAVSHDGSKKHNLVTMHEVSFNRTVSPFVLSYISKGKILHECISPTNDDINVDV